LSPKQTAIRDSGWDYLVQVQQGVMANSVSAKSFDKRCQSPLTISPPTGSGTGAWNFSYPETPSANPSTRQQGACGRASGMYSAVMEVARMKVIAVTSTAILPVPLGIAAPAYAQHDKGGENQDHPERRQSKQEQAKPEQQHAEQQRQAQNKQQPQPRGMFSRMSNIPV
jgi:hypothetical protein